MHDANFGRRLIEPGADLHDTAGIARHHHRCPSAENVFDFPFPQSLSHRRLSEVISPCAAAADIGFRKFYIVRTRHSADELPRLQGDPLGMREVAGIVIGNQIATRTELLIREPVCPQEFGQILDPRTEFLAGSVAGIVFEKVSVFFEC